MSAVLSPIKPGIQRQIQTMETQMCDAEPTAANSFADCLPWQDVIFQHILPCLDLQSILSLHAVNRTFRLLVQQYQYYVKSFNLSHAGRITPDLFLQISGGMRSLQALSLGPCSWITDRLAVDIIKYNQNLQWVNLSDCPGLTQATVLKVAIHCPGLLGLNICGNQDVGTDAVRQVVRRCPRIKALDMARCGRLDDRGMACIAGGAKMLRSLNICGCHSVTDVGVAHITLLPHLRHINVRETRITDNAVILLGKHVPSLTHVEVALCRRVTSRGVARLRAMNPRLHTDVPAKHHLTRTA